MRKQYAALNSIADISAKLRLIFIANIFTVNEYIS